MAAHGTYEKKFRRSDASVLREHDIQTIIAARGSMPNAAKAMASTYKISMKRVYEIWNTGGDLPVCGAGGGGGAQNGHRERRPKAPPPAGRSAKAPKRKDARLERADSLLAQV